MNNNPLVSIGLPIYNRPISFRKVLDSLLSQTYINIEINIGDNSENNESEKILEEYRNDNRIKYYKHDKNIGALANFKFVRDVSKGKYFMWVADDDYWDNIFIEKAVEKLENDPEAVACWPQVQFFNDNGVINYLPSSIYNQNLSDDDIISRLLKLNLQGAWFEFYCLVKTDIAKNFQAGSYKVMGEDVIFLNYLLLSGKCLMIDEPLFHYCYTYEQIGVYEKHNYKSEEYNEYARINPHLDLFVKCLKLILSCKKINLSDKINYYIIFITKVIFRKGNWIIIIKQYPVFRFINLAIINKNYFIIITCIPLYVFLFYYRIRYKIKHSLKKL